MESSPSGLNKMNAALEDVLLDDQDMDDELPLDRMAFTDDQLFVSQEPARSGEENRWGNGRLRERRENEHEAIAIDVDESGDFDPEEEARIKQERMRAAKLKRKMALSQPCDQCNEHKQSCSLAATKGVNPEQTNGECTACEVGGRECTGGGLPQRQQSMTIPDSEDENDDSDLEIVSVRELSIEEKAKIAARRTATQIANFPERLHLPLRFNEQGWGCSFCRDFRYSILGKSKQDAQNIQEKGTNLCHDCSASRLSILRCTSHDFRLLKRKIEQWPAQLKRMVQNDRAAKDDLWCSMCPGFALHACKECDMHLCGTCHRELSSFGGDLWKFITHTPPWRTEKRPLGLRADVDIARRNDLLPAEIRTLMGLE